MSPIGDDAKGLGRVAPRSTLDGADKAVNMIVGPYGC
jgi:hypothetical protein